MNLTGKRVAILVESQYQEMEVWYPLYRLKEAGITVVTLGTGAAEYKSKLGYPVKADQLVETAKASDYDGIVVPGGFAPDFMRRYDGPARLVREIFHQGKVVAAICHGLWIPASAGILRGKTATCFFAIKDDIINAGATYVDQEVCVDGNLVSARKPDDLPAFMQATLKCLAAQ
jgi:protease I